MAGRTRAARFHPHPESLVQTLVTPGKRLAADAPVCYGFLIGNVSRGRPFAARYLEADGP